MSNFERAARRRWRRAAFGRAKEGARVAAPLKAGRLPRGQERVIRWAWVPILGPLVRWILGQSLGRVGA